VCDEIASHIDSKVYDVLLTATGKRKHPILISISTATANNVGIGKTLWDYAVRVLNKDQDDDRLFALIYTIDEEDDPWVESSWIKANPGWGVSVQPDAIRAIMKQARNNPAQESAAMTRHLNVWQGADESLFSTRAWRSCADPTLTLGSFENQDCWISVDLASKVDLASVSIVFSSIKDGRNIYHVFGRHYLNQAALLDGRNAYYPVWAKDGHLVLGDGNETDYQMIEADILDLCSRFNVLSLGFDPWNATQLSQRLGAEGVNCVEIRQTLASMSEPTKELQAAMMAGRIVHNGDPVLEWAIGNCVGHYDKNLNVKANRNPNQDSAKIDPAIALIMSLALAIEAGPADTMPSLFM
jgi:phage terminase large subunit-like protein